MLLWDFLVVRLRRTALTTKHEYCYAYRVFQWWEKTFPKAKLHYVNGGLEVQLLIMGVSRVVTDMLMYQPDFVVVDFSVNDEPEKFFQETYEGLVRRMLTWSSVPAVLLLNNVFMIRERMHRSITIRSENGIVCPM